MTNIVNFPGLGLNLNINRVAFTIGIREIYWYGIIIGLGLVLAVLFCSREARRVGLPKDSIADIAIFATPIAVVCARLYFVLWEWRDYVERPADIFNIRLGGLAIYGAIIGGALTAYAYCRIKKLDIKKVFDVGSFGLLIGQSIGRWGNFMNVEAYGSETTLPWRMEIYSSELEKIISVHPTFLYESLWNIIGFAWLYIYRKKKRFEGEIFLLYISWYGLGRAWIEQLRVDSLPYNANYKISQIVAIISALAAIGFIASVRRKLAKQV